MAGVGSENGSRSAAVWSWPWLRCVREGKAGGVNDPIVTDQSYWNLDWLPDPPPTFSECRNVWDHAEHALSTSVEETHTTEKHFQGRHSSAWTVWSPHPPNSGRQGSSISQYLYIVSASTSPNHTRKFGVKFCPVSSSIATSPPPFNCNLEKPHKTDFHSSLKNTAWVIYLLSFS